MPLPNTQFDAIMRIYSRRQSEARRLLEQRQQEISQKIPRIDEIDREIASKSTQSLRRMLPGDTVEGKTELDKLKKEIAQLTQEKRNLLTAGGFPEDYLSLPCHCPRCHDTGFIGGEKCVCFRREEVSLLYAQSNLEEMFSENTFRHFSLDYYPEDMINSATGLNARQTAAAALKTARKFVKDFDQTHSNLFLYGNTGVGKTFLSHCIARALLDSAHLVMYFSAQELFERSAAFTFTSGEGNPSDILDCDFLVIDDLGTELTNSFVSSQLFFCVNERLLRRKSTLISTNLSLADFSSVYSERTFSRITSSYQMVKLIGTDIRVQKRFGRLSK